MRKILIIFAHPVFVRSKINAAMRKAVEALEHVTFHDLYSCYPNFLIDVEHEQRLCIDHDVIIFQHPFYWYSTPSIMKEWQDLVLQHNWAYGSKGTFLKGKYFLQTLTAGASDEAYQPDGDKRTTIPELLAPFQAMARLCQMNWLPPFAVLGVQRGMPATNIQNYAETYRRTIISLRDTETDLSSLEAADNLCTHFNIDQSKEI